MLALAPASLVAQSQATGQAGSTTTGAAQSQAATGFSAATTLRLEATIAAARSQGLPTQPLADRIAEGQAKGASEAQIVAATDRAQAQLVASHEALVQAGRSEPSQEEVARGAQILASGATSAQLEAFITRSPSDRRLEVAFSVVNQLALSGIGATDALASVAAQLGRGATDGQLVSLTGALSGSAAGSTAGLGIGVGLTRKP
jgi:hypothetical protein